MGGRECDHIRRLIRLTLDNTMWLSPFYVADNFCIVSFIKWEDDNVITLGG